METLVSSVKVLVSKRILLIMGLVFGIIYHTNSVPIGGSGSPLHSLAESLRLQTTQLYTEYCNQVADHLPIFDTEMSSAEKCHSFASSVRANTVLPPVSNYVDNVTEDTLPALLNDTQQVSGLLTGLAGVMLESLEESGCREPLSNLIPKACHLSCIKDRTPEQNMVCDIHKNLVLELDDLMIHLQQEIGSEDLLPVASEVELDVNASDSHMQLRFYNVVVLDYAAEMVTEVKEALNRYR